MIARLVLLAAWIAPPIPLLVAGVVATAAPVPAAPADVSFAPTAPEVEVHDFAEVIVNVQRPSAKNPFTGASVSGWLRRDGGERIEVGGFCDSDDGSVHRIRFMPSKPGKHSFGVRYREGNFSREHEGSFVARDARRRGGVRVDPAHPWHFVWEGTGRPAPARWPASSRRVRCRYVPTTRSRSPSPRSVPPRSCGRAKRVHSGAGSRRHRTSQLRACTRSRSSTMRDSGDRA